MARKRREIPARMARLKQRLEAWRKQRARGERIPNTLWKAAAKCAAGHGVSSTATTLKINYHTLQRHVQLLAAPSSSDSSPEPNAFVELPTFTSGCTVELENRAGDKMRVHVNGTPTADLMALTSSFWKRR